ncbi:MAG: porin [Armatimonadetes bacterium]|nr:porin [Armatimonadota bacterium]MDW8121921.1 porin [Armatimonadota bacterium]
MSKRSSLKWLFVPSVLVIFLGTAMGFSAEQPTVESLQAEIAKLKSQLDKLQTQLAQIQKEQKSSQKVVQRFEPLTVRGYIQMRYEKNTSLATDVGTVGGLARGRAKDTFRLRRVRLDVRGTPIRGTLYRLQLDSSGRDLELRDAYLETQIGDGTFTFGHFKVPLLEEVIESSATRWTPERAVLSTRLFPGERDRGIAYTWSMNGGSELTLGLFSGTLTTETLDSLTTRKSWLVRVAAPLGEKGKWGRAWIGMMDGIGRRNFGTDAAPNIRNFDRDRQVVGLNLTTPEGITFRAEFLRGKDFGTAARPSVSVQGWYALVGYQIPKQPYLLYAKRDLFDPDRGVRGNTFSRWAFGIQYDLNRSTRFNLTWENQKDPARITTGSGSIWTFQAQTRY